jgi:hypothetical protein
MTLPDSPSASATAEVLLRQQLGDRDVVELPELGELRHGDRAVAALVGADDDGLPLALGELLDLLEGEPLLLADRTKATAQSSLVLRHGFLLVVD